MLGAAGLAGCAQQSGSPSAPAASSPTAPPPGAPTGPSASPSPAELTPASWNAVTSHWSDSDLEAYTKTVPHLFLHQMIPFPQVAFAQAKAVRDDFDDWYLTKIETMRLMDQLRERDYILVDLFKVFTMIDGQMAPNPDFRVPRGKKPIIISIDDLSFNRFLLGKGFADRIIVDEQGLLSTEGKDPETGKALITRDNSIPSTMFE